MYYRELPITIIYYYTYNSILWVDYRKVANFVDPHHENGLWLNLDPHTVEVLLMLLLFQLKQ